MLSPRNGLRRGLGRGGGQGRQPEGFGLGPEGECICPKCNTSVPHQRGIPCYEEKCPKCSSPLIRKR